MLISSEKDTHARDKSSWNCYTILHNHQNKKQQLSSPTRGVLSETKESCHQICHWMKTMVLKEFQRVSKDTQTDNSVLNLELWPWPWSDLSHTCAHQNRFMVLYMSAKAFQNVTNPSRVIERTCNTVIQCLTLNYDSKPTWVKHTWHLCIVICKSHQGFKR